MSRGFSFVAGILLILAGCAVLAVRLVGPALGVHIWQFWPLFVIGAGLSFVLPALLARRKRGLGGLWIPGMPILVTGGILLFNSLFNAWSAWRWLWPLEVLSLAAGFLLAALSMRVVWLLVPVSIIGCNGLLLQFCALTGLWEAWAVMWPIELLSVGLALLAIYPWRRRAGLLLAGLILCALAAVAMMGMTLVASLVTVLPLTWLISRAGPVVLIVVGVLMLFASLLRRPPARKLASAE